MLVYGTTYFISELPAPEFWEKDLEEIKKRGMNTVKHLAVWEDCEPEEGEFRFDNLKKLLGLCDKIGLDVLLEIRHKNRGFPRWFIEKYPECAMVTADGHRTWCGACYNNPRYQEMNGRFVKRLVKELKGYQCLKYWDIWNEPHLNSTGDHHYDLKKMVCYCKHCRNIYKEWRKEQNLHKQSTGDGWEGFDLPRLSRVFRDYRDRLYFVKKVMVEEAGRLYNLIREEDSRPIALHDVFISPVFPAMTLGNDDWELANTVDVYGTSSGGPTCTGEDAGEKFYWFNPMVLDETRSAAKGKSWWNSEWHVAGGILPFAANRDRNFEAVKKEYFEILTRGGTGIITWAYRTYSNRFCLIDIYGKPTGTFEHMTGISRRLKDVNHFKPKKVRKPEVAIVYDPENQFKIWAEMGNPKVLTDATESIYKYLYDNNYMIDFLHPLAVDKIEKYKVIVLPAPFGLGKKMREGLKKYVAAGGILISEGCFSYLDGYATSMQGAPAYGFAKIFGLQITDMSLSAASGKDGELIFKDKGGNKFTVVYRHHYEVVKQMSAEVLLESDVGAKVTINNYGKGKAMYISCLLFPPTNYSRDGFYNSIAIAGELIVSESPGKKNGSTNNYRILNYIFENLGMKSTLPQGVRRDIFGALIVYHNNSKKEYTVNEDTDTQDIFTEEQYIVRSNILLIPGETKVLLRKK